MNISQKKPMVRKQLDWIVDHDDAPLTEVEGAVSEMKAYLDEKLVQAKQRRMVKEQEAIRAAP
jgi:hypothetical protein